MGQRVNIQYSVELEDLEEEVNRLYSNAITHLIVLPDSCINLGTEGLEKVDSLRQRLAKTDIMLGDIQNIIEGYVRFKTQPPQTQAPESPSQSEELEMEQIEDKIAKFKEMLNAQSNQELEEENKLAVQD
jgi:Mg2+ and Co2+ transporter CorA